MMREKSLQIFNARNFLAFILLASLLVSAGCSSNLLSGENNAPPQVQEPQAPPAPIVVDGIRTSYADIVARTAPAVVNINSERRAERAPQQFPFGDDEFFRQFQFPQQNQRPPVERGVGSGVIVSADGTILTNYHVVEGADKIRVEMNDGKTFDAKIVGLDQPSDLAVLKIEGQNLPFLNLGNSDNVRVGDIILAIGNPLGIGQTVTAGIISAKGRRTGLSDGSFEDFLQIDAPINRGNSGGALVNLSGELIGINSQILSGGAGGGNIGIGFSIPSNMAKSVMEQLIANGRVRRGMLGVNIQNITEDLAQGLGLKDTKGVLVSNVRPNSAAGKAGIERGDVITAINGEMVEDSNVLRNKVAGTLPGSEITLTIVRNGGEQQVKAVLEEFQVEEAKNSETPNNNNNNRQTPEQQGKLGLTLQPVTPEIAARLQLSGDAKGLIVTEVEPNGAAAARGVARGDVILEINKQEVNTLDDVQSAIEKSGNNPILLLISRRGQTIFLTVNSN
jgi:serine protease Do